MMIATSRDGTRIAHDRAGEGRPLILVDGALTTRTSDYKTDLVARLAGRFTVFTYDRRGRGDSGDTAPYAVQREIEDLEAIIDVAGPPVVLYGHSSGASLALEATLALEAKVAGLAMYEAPYDDNPESRERWATYLRELADALAEGRSGDAVALFLAYIGTPADEIDAMRTQPFWPGMAALGPTLAYDHAGILGAAGTTPVERAAGVRVPTLVLHGTASFPFMAPTARALSEAIPGAELRTLDGQTHNVEPSVIAPILIETFADH